MNLSQSNRRVVPCCALDRAPGFYAQVYSVSPLGKSMLEALDLKAVVAKVEERQVIEAQTGIPAPEQYHVR
jgi:hypothetical protein